MATLKKKTSSKAAKPAAKAKARPTPPPRPPAKSAPTRPDAVELGELVRAELGVLRDLIESRFAPLQPGAGLVEEVDSIRRLLSELMEQRMESVIGALVAIRNRAAALAGDETVTLVAEIDALLETLGAVRFEARLLDHADPLIHTIARERHDSQQPAGVVLECLRPGYRTGRGRIVAKALVAVNRRT